MKLLLPSSTVGLPSDTSGLCAAAIDGENIYQLVIGMVFLTANFNDVAILAIHAWWRWLVVFPSCYMHKV